VVEAGAEELHLVAMQSKVKGVPCFWCWSAQTGLYTACLGMLNQRCQAIVLDLDQTIVSSYNENSLKTFIKKIESCLENTELSAAKQLALRDQLSKVSENHIFLKDFVDKGAITVDGEIVRIQHEKSMLHKPGGVRQVIVRPVIRVPKRNAVLTYLDPMVCTICFDIPQITKISFINYG
jgi:RNA polymerase II C-terminal domain phosphatase-like 1/2